jgi:hypothetical protein
MIKTDYPARTQTSYGGRHKIRLQHWLVSESGYGP